MTDAKRPRRARKQPDGGAPAGAPAPAGLVVQRVRIAELVENPRNVRSHNARNLDAIELSLREYGQVEPLVVREVAGKLVLLGGHGRLAVMRRLGWEHADVVVVDPGSELRADRLGLALNRPGELATWDTEALAELLAGLDDPDVLVGGLFEDAELTALLDGPDEGTAPPPQPPPPRPPPVQTPGGATRELDPGAMQFAHNCPRCGFGFD